MRLALIADIHGNAAALDAVLADLDAADCDAVATLGDVVNAGPDSDRCYRRLRALGVPMLRGNHERYVVEAADGAPSMQADNWAPVRFTARQLTAAEIEELRALPRTLELRDLLGPRAAALPPLLLCHAAPGDDSVNVHPATPDAEIRAAFAAAGAPTIARGHNHLPFARRVAPRGGEGDPVAEDLHLISLGSAGIPLDGTCQAQYALLEPHRRGGWRVEHRRVPYDVAAAAAAFFERGLIDAGGVVARLLLREVRIGSHQLMPFLRYHATLPEETSWEAAFERFVRIGVAPLAADPAADPGPAQGTRMKP